MRTITVCALGLSLITLLCPTRSGYAATAIFTDEPSFLAAAADANVTFSTEGFEGLALSGWSTAPISVPPVTLTETATGVAGFLVSSSSDYVTEGTRAIEWDSNTIGMTFTFDAPVAAFGFDLQDFGDIGAPGNTLFVSIDGDSPSTVFEDFVGPNGNHLFVGIVGDPFSEVRLSTTASGEALGFDRLRFGPAGPTVCMTAGKLLLVKNPKPSDPAKRKILYKVKESSSSCTIVGDPTVSGVTLALQLDGNSDCYDMPASGWSRIGSLGFRYKDPQGTQGPVKAAAIKKTPSGSFQIKVRVFGNNGVVSVIPPDPGIEASTNLNVGGEAHFCSTFGGTIGPNNQKTFKAKNAAAPFDCNVSACSPSGAFLELADSVFD